MRENEHSSDFAEYFNAHKDDPEWKFAISALSLFIGAAIVFFDNEFHKLRISMCGECGATFLSLRAEVEHYWNQHSRKESSTETENLSSGEL
jgi:hypothetical protein